MNRIWRALRFGKLTIAVALVWAGAAAAHSPDGFRGATFGMSSEAVAALLADEGMINIERRQTAEDDLIIDAELGGEPNIDLRYVFPAGHDALALVVAFYPSAAELARIEAELEAEYGPPWEAEMSEWWLEQLKHDMPETPRGLTVWGGGEGEQQRNRFVRLWSFEDYLTVEYLDTTLFP